MSSNLLTPDFLRKIQNGDIEAFETLFRAYFQRLVNFAYRFLRDIPTSENMVQDIFADIWRKRSRVNPDLDFKIYLYTAAKNRALKQLKRQNIENDLRLELNHSSNRPNTPFDDLNDSEISEAISRGIENLPDKCRLIFAMNRFDGLTYKEIASALGISIKTVETQMGRALKNLRKRLMHLLVSALIR
ncbi:MAG: RNA polymerase sigma-70 factor [candidate division Zixibacteria bacterium]|nr:RNA polymerase sigma-70 factor [candidate division Zixibacteria bacterium]